MGSSSQNIFMKIIQEILENPSPPSTKFLAEKTLSETDCHTPTIFQATQNVFQTQRTTSNPYKFTPAFLPPKKTKTTFVETTKTSPKGPAYGTCQLSNAQQTKEHGIHRQIGSPQDGNLHDGSHSHLSFVLFSFVVERKLFTASATASAMLPRQTFNI